LVALFKPQWPTVKPHHNSAAGKRRRSEIAGGVFGNAFQAVTFGRNKGIVKAFLQKRADVNALGGKFGSALQTAAFTADKELVELLIERAADVNARGGNFGSVMHAALASGTKLP
jgi:ankyrin repeat protein